MVYRPVEAVLVPPPWYRGRVVLIGDAAHATSPHVGQRGAMAMEDALVLAEEITDNDLIAPALERFMGRRYERSSDRRRSPARWPVGDRQQHDADFVGLTIKSVMTTAAPI